jgi:hypothetical protein
MGHKIKIRNIGRWSLLASYLGNNKGYNKLVCVNVVRIFFEEFYGNITYKSDIK